MTGGGQPSIAATGAFLKYVILPGSLQDKSGSGISVATEFGPLLPGINADSGVGFSWAGIVSQRWDWGTAHFNVETNLTRDHQAEAFLDVSPPGVDEHSADQLVLPLALSQQPARFRTACVSSHLLTNVAVIQRFLPRRIEIDAPEGAPGCVRIE